MLDVFFYEAFQEEEQALKHHLSSHIQAGFTWKTIQEEADQIPPAPLISIRTQSIIPLSWANKMTGLLSRSTGYDHIYRYLQKCQKNLPCGYLPVYCSRSVAEQTMLLWMALFRKLGPQRTQFDTFNRNGLTGRECFKKTLLVVGVGHIGYEIVQLGQGLGMTVFGVDIDKKYPEVTYVSIEKGLSQADIVVCAMNLTSENLGYFHYQLLKQGKPKLIFINIARGELSPIVDLWHLIEEGFLGGVALDVYENESELATLLRRGSGSHSKDLNVLALLKLAKQPNVILTPHNAFNTHEALERKSVHSVQQVIQFLEQGQFIWTVPFS